MPVSYSMTRISAPVSPSKPLEQNHTWSFETSRGPVLKATSSSSSCGCDMIKSLKVVGGECAGHARQCVRDACRRDKAHYSARRNARDRDRSLIT